MSRSEQLQLLLKYVQESPLNLVQTNLLALSNFIDQDQYSSAIICSLMEREKDNLGAYAGTIWKDRAKHAMALGFIRTVAQKAGLGCQILGLATAPGQKADEVGHKVFRIGSYYSGYRSVSPGDIPSAIGEFTKVFLRPIVDHLTLWQERDDQILSMLIRYKQRAEWFSARDLLEKAKSADGQIEKALKIDLYRYLFDRGLDFTIDPKSPSSRGEADVMSARFPDGQRLVLEAKVFDDHERDQSWVKRGVPQAASYARDWAEPRAHLVIYNIARNSILSFAGAKESGTYWVTNNSGIPVFLIVLDLGIDVTASQASNSRPIVIDLTS